VKEKTSIDIMDDFDSELAPIRIYLSAYQFFIHYLDFITYLSI